MEESLVRTAQVQAEHKRKSQIYNSGVEMPDSLPVSTIVLPVEIHANVSFGGIRCKLLKNLPRELDSETMEDDSKSDCISLFGIASQSEEVLNAVKAETVGVLELGVLNVVANVTDGGTNINTSVTLQHFKVVDHRPNTLEHYKLLKGQNIVTSPAKATPETSNISSSSGNFIPSNRKSNPHW